MRGARRGTGYGRASWSSGAAEDAPMSRDCPKCKAPAHSRCFAMRTWVELPGHPEGGFYAQRKKVVHEERRTRRADLAPVTSERGELRTKILAVSMRKLAGGPRIALRQWMGGSRRTEDELRERLAELEAMGDLPW